MLPHPGSLVLVRFRILFLTNREMTTSSIVTILNKIELIGVDAIHFIFFQEPVNLEPNVDVIVWRTLNIQAGGKGKLSVALDTEYTATVTHGGDSTETSKAILAKHGDFLIVKKDVEIVTLQC